MPIWEEKVISPLAVRFTQQRIRTHFRDNREVEATIKEIKALPGAGDYDIILDAPFPAIEIIRWSPHGRNGQGQSHWFTYDNRRLYCLQRVAAEYWPKRVGAAVEVLYADPGAIRKKLDTRTDGLSVSIGHAFAVAGELKEWSWQKAVKERAPPGNFTLQAESCVAVDEAKSNVGDLMDAPAVSNSLQLASSTSNSCSLPKDASATANVSVAVHELEDLATGASEASRPECSSLTSLIAQLMNLKTNEHLQSHGEASNDACSIPLSESTCPTEFDAASQDTTILTPTAASIETESFGLSDGENNASPSQKSMTEAFKDPAPQQETRDMENAIKQAQVSNAAQQVQMAQASQAAQLQWAHQMAQWQMARWHHAQMAQWQYAAFAHQAKAGW